MNTRCPLLEAFGAEPGRVLALAGGGGKTALMYALARAGVGRGWRVLTTTTTRIWPPDASDSPCLMLVDGLPDPAGAISARLDAHAHVTMALRRTPDGKLAGVSAPLVDELARTGAAELIVVEADGSAGRPLKAAREGEPVFPRSSTDCVLLMGIEALGAPLDEQWVFRSALTSEITGLAPGAPVTLEAAVELLIGSRGLAARAPAESRVLAFLNKVESPELERQAHHLACALLARGDDRLVRVVAGSLKHAEAGFTAWERE